MNKLLAGFSVTLMGLMIVACGQEPYREAALIDHDSLVGFSRTFKLDDNNFDDECVDVAEYEIHHMSEEDELVTSRFVCKKMPISVASNVISVSSALVRAHACAREEKLLFLHSTMHLFSSA
jgi:hypothetical protein